MEIDRVIACENGKSFVLGPIYHQNRPTSKRDALGSRLGPSPFPISPPSASLSIQSSLVQNGVVHSYVSVFEHVRLILQQSSKAPAAEESRVSAAESVKSFIAGGFGGVCAVLVGTSSVV